LKPSSLGIDARLDFIVEYFFRQTDNSLGQIFFSGRVLNDVAGQSAAIANEVSKQSEFSVRH
jgi:hypothetical protein